MTDKPTQTGNNTVSSDFMRVLMALKDNINRDLQVADVAVVEQVGTDDMYLCKVLADDSVVACNKLANLTVNVGDAVCILYMTHEFRANLSRVKNNLRSVKLSDTSLLHTKSNGIIIGVL